MIIADASVINKLFLPNETNYQQADNLVQQHLQKVEKIVVPNLIFYEVANTLATKSSIPFSVVIKSLTDLYLLDLVIVDLTEKNLKLAVKFARKYRISVYDATYAVLAKQKGCDLVTADRKFVEQTKLTFIKSLKSYR